MTDKLSRSPRIHEIVLSVNRALDGKLNTTVALTLDNATSTTVVDEKVGTDTAIFITPTNAAAATEFASGSMYVSSQTPGTGFVITHTAAASRDIRYALIG